MEDIHQEFILSVNKYKKMRARFDQRQILKHEFELLVRFEEETYPLWGLYQQAVVGNINVPKLDYLDPDDKSWMWSWIKGNRKWHAWNKCKGLTRADARDEYIKEVKRLEAELPSLLEDWKDDQDPQIPDRNAHVPEEEKVERERVTKEAKENRRRRDAAKRKEEEVLGMWDE